MQKLKSNLMQKQPSLTAIRHVVAAFRSAIKNIDGSEKKSKKKEKEKISKTKTAKKHILLEDRYR